MKTTGPNLTISIKIIPGKGYNEETIEDNYSVPVPSFEAYVIRSCKNAESYSIRETKNEVIFKITRPNSEEELTLKRETSEDIINNIFLNIKKRA